jgi:hypothetical protein
MATNTTRPRVNRLPLFPHPSFCRACGCPDKHRWRVGLQPMPKAVTPPAPVTDERRQEIVAQVAVIRARSDGANGASAIAQQPPAAAPAEAQKQKETVGARA